MLKKIEKYLCIVSPLLILASLFYFYLTAKFKLFSIMTLVIGIGIGLFFIVRFYDDIVRKITKRKIKYGINSVIITLIVLALVVIVYLVLVDHNKIFDLTKTRRFSLSDQTAKILEKLDGPVHGYAFYSKQQDTASIRELFNEYHYHYKDFDFEILDPDLNPGIVEEMGIEEYGEVYIEYGGKTEKVKSKNEEGITNALIKLSQTEIKKVYFITGHGEHSIEDYSGEGYDKIKAAIKAENYDAEEILLLREEKIPDDCAVLISAGPKGDYEAHEIELIENYVQDGGRVLFLLDPAEAGKEHINIAVLLERYGLILGNDVIIDPLSRVLSGDFFMPVINSYTYNPITKDFRFATFLRLARSISTKEDAGENIFTRIVANTGEASWAETNLESLLSDRGADFDEGIDIQGPVSVMAYSRVTLASKDLSEGEVLEADTESDKPEKPEEDALILAVGDSDFITNSMYQTQGNKDLFLNTINFLADRGDFITIRPKQQESVYLTMTAKQGRIAFFVSVIAIPLFIIIVGLYFTIQRRVKS